MRAFTAAPIGRCPRDASSFLKRMDGSGRLGVASLEDKIVQRAVVEVFNAIYEEDFLGWSASSSIGARPTEQALWSLKDETYCIKLTSHTLSVTCLMPTFWPAKTGGEAEGSFRSLATACG